MTVKILKFRPNIRCDKIFFQSCIMNHGYNTCRHPPIRPADSGLDSSWTRGEPTSDFGPADSASRKTEPLLYV